LKGIRRPATVIIWGGGFIEERANWGEGELSVFSGFLCKVINSITVQVYLQGDLFRDANPKEREECHARLNS
jgi:hypothetical protein